MSMYDKLNKHLLLIKRLHEDKQRLGKKTISEIFMFATSDNETKLVLL